jgi:very-short-patch-repair endonuclease
MVSINGEITRKYETDLKRYFLKDRIFDHQSEFEFYKILRDDILGDRFLAMIQIPLASLVGVRRTNNPVYMAHFGRIKSRRVDYVICRKQDLKPLLALELDGSSHENEDRKERDQFVDALFEAVGLPILHVSLQKNYNKAAVALSIARKLNLEERVIRKLEAMAGKPLITKGW